MDASIIWENPGLTLLGVLAGILLILLIPVIGALRRSRDNSRHFSARTSGTSSDRREDPYFDSRGKSTRQDPGSRRLAVRMHEPGPDSDDYDDDYDYDDDDDYDYDDDDERTDRGRRRSGRYVDIDRTEPERWRSRDEDIPAGVFGEGERRGRTPARTSSGKAVWFVIGICVGAGGLALLWSLPSANPLSAVLALLERPEPTPAAVDAPAAPADTKVQDRVSEPAAIGDGGDATVGDLVDSFVTDLKAQLPMAVGPGITMVNVDSNGAVVALGFTIAQTVAEDDIPKLQEELETRFQSSICATTPDPTNIHGLNQQGVSFIITYVDLLGKKVAGMTVDPNFCSDPT